MKKVLSDADVTKLRRTMADVDKLRGQIRTLHDRSKSSKRAGAHYVVKTPSGGIPASVGDEPGSADCNIHIRDGDPKELRDTTRAETVYNFGPAIPGDTILIAHRDAWGDLWAGEPSSGGVCEELDLQPGSYRGIAGATTAPGETGPVIVTGCEDDVTIDAVNHSGCTFYLGDMITVNVDPCCVAHFTGCSCCGAEQEPPACCDRSYAICICGQNVIFPASGSVTIDVSDCCECDNATLELTFTCSEPGGGGGGGGGGPGGEEPPGEPLGAGPGGGATIAGTWKITCDGDEDTGELDVDLSLLCDDENNVSIEGYIDSTLCFLPFTVSNYLTGCTEGPGSDDGIPSGPDECFCWDCPRYGVLVEVTGVANNTGPDFNASFSCSNCDDVNGTYFLPYPAAVSLENCSSIEMTSGLITLCNAGGIDRQYDVTAKATCGTGDIRIISQVGFPGAGATSRTQDIAEPVPCPVTSSGGTLSTFLGVRCDMSGANVTSRWV